MILVEKENLKNLRELFEDIRFYMGKSVLDGKMGEAYVDNIATPKFAVLLVRSYCFMSGKIDKESLKEIIEKDLKKYKLIPSDNLKEHIEEIFKDNIIKQERYSIKKNPKFDIEKLQKNINNLEYNYSLQKIDKVIAQKIKDERFITISDNYEEDGIGYCAVYGDEIIGVASSNILYNDGIEVNIRVEEEHRRKGIAFAIASKLILECIDINKMVSWDAANLYSVKLAEKLGFQYDSTYNVYIIKS